MCEQPAICPSEKLLPRPTRTTLSQLRSGHCASLRSYQARVRLAPDPVPTGTGRQVRWIHFRRERAWVLSQEDQEQEGLPWMQPWRPHSAAPLQLHRPPDLAHSCWPLDQSVGCCPTPVCCAEFQSGAASLDPPAPWAASPGWPGLMTVRAKNNNRVRYTHLSKRCASWSDEFHNSYGTTNLRIFYKK